MPLRDHFHAPLAPARSWESFNSYWAVSISRRLNRHVLPSGYFSEVQVHFGRVKVDVASLSRSSSPSTEESTSHEKGAVALATAPTSVWAPPSPSMTTELCFPDEIEVQIFRQEGGSTLVAALELISPGNKDRREHRTAFAAKCLSYLTQNVGLIMIDVVTSRNANLHNELVDLMGTGEDIHYTPDSGLYAVSYRPWKSEERKAVDLWTEELRVEHSLPTLPLSLGDIGCAPADLELTYTEACEDAGLVESN